ncbi:MAG TPA: HXXEE domain-containing protein [Acidobacteriota bacterium]|nr:HXXEE domain-containing protein [Acidobacteriota bacterium]
MQAKGYGLTGRWTWLYPITLTLHLLEELWAAGGYHPWLASHGGAAMSTVSFLALTGAGVVALSAGLALLREDWLQWLVMGLAFFYLVNTAAHLIECLLTHSFSPGSFSGVLLWLPLALFTLSRTRQRHGRIPAWGRLLALTLGGQAVLTFSLWRPLLWQG